MKAILERIELLLTELLQEFKQQKIPVVAHEWLRGDEVMAMLSISQRTLYNYYLSGAFETKRFGGTRFYCKASVLRMK